MDRVLFAAASQLLPRDRWSSFLVTPQTLLRWHRELVRKKWTYRRRRLIGRPRRIKQILCDSATDLGRDRSFQGHGMLDVLRAFQSI